MNRARWNWLILLVAVLAPLFPTVHGLPLEVLWLPLLALGILATADRDSRLPVCTWPQIAILCLLPVGLLGLSGAERAGGIREVVQLLLIAVVSPYVYRACMRRTSWTAVTIAMALAFPVLLLLRVLPVFGSPSPRKGGMMLVLALPFVLAALNRLPRPRYVVGGAVAAGLLTGMALPHGGLVLAAVAALGVTAWAARSLARPAAIAAVALFVASLVSPFASPWQALRPHRDADHLRRGVIEWLATARAPGQYPLGAGLGCYRPAMNRLRQEVAHRPHPEDNRVPQDGNSLYAVALVEAGPAGLLGVVLFLGLGLALALRSSTEPVGEENDREQRAVLAGALVGAMVSGGFGLLLARGVGIWVGGLVGLATMPQPAALRRPLRRWAACGTVILALALLAFVGNEAKREPGAPSHLNRLLARQGTAASPLRVVVLLDPLATTAERRVLRVEAETAREVQAPFAVVSLGDASGGQGLVIPDRGGKGKGSARFVIAVPKAGTYVLYARVYWDDGCSNSLGFRLAGQPDLVLASETYERWHTLEASHPLTLPQGELRVELQNLEDGIRLDYWGLRLLSIGP